MQCTQRNGKRDKYSPNVITTTAIRLRTMFLWLMYVRKPYTVKMCIRLEYLRFFFFIVFRFLEHPFKSWMFSYDLIPYFFLLLSQIFYYLYQMFQPPNH